MNVHIDLIKREFNEQKGDRIHAVRQHGTIAFEDAARDRLIANETLVHKEILLVTRRPPLARCRNEAGDLRDELPATRHRQETIKQVPAEDLKRPLAQ